LKGRVLVIDDETEIRRTLDYGLTHEGYTVVTCSDGISAIHALSEADDSGEGYDYIVTDVFLPDIDGLKMLKVIRYIYPEVPVLVVTGFGDDDLERSVLSKSNTGYLEKPIGIADLVEALQRLSRGYTGSPAAVTGPEEDIEGPFRAYLTVRITEPDRSMEIYDSLRRMDGIVSCDAVRGDFDLVLVARAPSRAGIEGIMDSIGSLDGIDVVSVREVKRPRLERDVERFINVYRHMAGSETRTETDDCSKNTGYLIVDIDPDSIQRVYTTVFFMDDVVSCDMLDECDGLMVTIADRGAVGRTPKTVQRLRQIDGVLRVREARAIRLVED